mmetsp:Transcript_61427/g.171731  ORF Transcript_61427/g.171731 Transcript_61427/m.171731 type:complete len:234 (-) Transcript_61427:611-1312(-)
MGSSKPPILKGSLTAAESSSTGQCTGSQTSTLASCAPDGRGPKTAETGNMPMRPASRPSTSKTPLGVTWRNRSPAEVRCDSNATGIPRKGNMPMNAAKASLDTSSQPTKSSSDARSAFDKMTELAVSNIASYSSSAETWAAAMDGGSRWTQSPIRMARALASKRATSGSAALEASCSGGATTCTEENSVRPFGRGVSRRIASNIEGSPPVATEGKCMYGTLTRLSANDAGGVA